MEFLPHILLYSLIIIYFLALPKIFSKAGIESWKGYVPFYNVIIWTKICKKPWWWSLILLVPGVNLLMLFVLNVELSRAFNLRGFSKEAKIVFLPWLVIPQIATNPSIKYVGPINYKDKTFKKSFLQEWFDAIIFAVIAATVIRTFFLEAYKIPTPSMEKNLMVGDFLFVSKISYGPKLPNTPFTFPFTHNTLPFGDNIKSYVEIFTLPYFRLPGLGNIKRNDVVVFNFPAGDTVLRFNPNITYYTQLDGEAWITYANQTGGTKYGFEKEKEKYRNMIRNAYIMQDFIITRPVDKKDNYIKRCVALPGDTIFIKDRQLYINGVKSGDTELMKFKYYIKTNSKPSIDRLKEKHDISDFDSDIIYFENDSVLEITLTHQEYLEYVNKYGQENVIIKNKPLGYYLQNYNKEYLPIFPNDIKYGWTEDNFGPLLIPKKGATVDITINNLPVYRRIIQAYEKNSLQVKDSVIYINGKATNQYTFKQDYYWLMGDNRHNSADSRFWGFVPHDHVVGKAVLIWFSSGPSVGIRWNRIFKRIK